jgi:hypothetical protein
MLAFSPFVFHTMHTLGLPLVVCCLVQLYLDFCQVYFNNYFSAHPRHFPPRMQRPTSAPASLAAITQNTVGVIRHVQNIMRNAACAGTTTSLFLLQSCYVRPSIFFSRARERCFWVALSSAGRLMSSPWTATGRVKELAFSRSAGVFLLSEASVEKRGSATSVVRNREEWTR